MSAPRIAQIELDDATILWRNADIEQERRIAIFDLIEDNQFKPLRSWQAGHPGLLVMVAATVAAADSVAGATVGTMTSVSGGMAPSYPPARSRSASARSLPSAIHRRGRGRG